jgi:hypothetical protein
MTETFFPHCVVHVFFVGSQKKMIGIGARRIITVVANFFSFFNWAYKVLVHNPCHHFVSGPTLTVTGVNRPISPLLEPVYIMHPEVSNTNLFFALSKIGCLVIGHPAWPACP